MLTKKRLKGMKIGPVSLQRQAHLLISLYPDKLTKHIQYLLRIFCNIRRVPLQPVNRV